MNKPSYPVFRPLELADEQVFTAAFRLDPPEVSEFTFSNLYSWRNAYALQVSFLDGSVLVRSDKQGRPYFFPPIGSGNIKTVMERIMVETSGAFFRVPAGLARVFQFEEGYTVTADADNSDYLYKVEDLRQLAGRKYDGKRNLIKKFATVYDYEYVTFNAANADECLRFEEQWCTVKDCDGVEGLRNEREAIREMIAHFDAFGLIGGAITVGQDTAAVAIGQQLNAQTLVMHVLKADANLRGAYQIMLQEFLRREAESFEFVNLEQDLGIEGLRKAKESYHPCSRVEKYIVSLRTG